MKSSMLLAMLLAGISLQVAAECAAPQAPAKVPDGATASQDDMVLAMREFKQYNLDVDAYSKCMEADAQKRVDALGPPLSPEAVQKKAVEIKNASAKLANAEIDKAQVLAGRFNEQIRAYKQAHAAK